MATPFFLSSASGTQGPCVYLIFFLQPPCSRIIPLPTPPSSNSKLLYTEVTLGIEAIRHPSMRGSVTLRYVNLTEEVLEMNCTSLTRGLVLLAPGRWPLFGARLSA